MYNSNMPTGENTAKTDRGCTLHLIAILVIVIILLIIAKFTFPGLPEISIAPTPANTPQPTAPITKKLVNIKAFLQPSTDQIAKDKEFLFAVGIQELASPVTTLDVTVVSQDKNIIMKSASPSAFFKDQITFVNSIATDSASVRIALGSVKPASGSGVLFTVVAHSSKSASGSATIMVSALSKGSSYGSTETLPVLADPLKLLIVPD